MKKAEIIRRYGRAEYERRLKQKREWDLKNPEKVKSYHHEQFRKGGKHYQKHLEDQRTGLRKERRTVRSRHRRFWGALKKIIAPDSVIHHSWKPGTAEYDGVALVEKDQHTHGIIDVIKVLDGEIKVFTEKEIKKREEATEK